MEPHHAPCEERLTFGLASSTYHLRRPRYPGVLFDHCFRLIPPRPHVLEVGAGTGIATIELLHRGARVVAVEPDERMRAELRTNTRSFGARLDIVPQPLERFTTHRRFDCILAAQSYHWIPLATWRTTVEHHLRPGGTLTVIDVREITPDEQTRRLAGQVASLSARHGGRGKQRFPTLASIDHVLGRSLPLRKIERVDCTQRFDLPRHEYQQLLSTFSEILVLPPDVRRRLLEDVGTEIDRHHAGVATRYLVFSLGVWRLGQPDRPR